MITAEMVGPPLLAVRGLRTEFATRRGVAVAVNDVSFDVAHGTTLGLVGESGSGKSVTCLSLLGLVAEPGRVVAGSICLEGDDLEGLSQREMRKVLGRRIATILQDPMSSLNPAFTIGEQIAEVLRIHHGMTGPALWKRVEEVLDKVRIPSARTRMREYPHAMSGGMRQRVVAAMAIACEPALLIADEPTTALDVTTQAAFLKLLRSLQRESGLGAIFVTHDFAVVARVCDSVAVMYAGRIVETGTTQEVLTTPRHPYTRALLDSVPKIEERLGRLRTIPGQPPALAGLDEGCAFRWRCSEAEPQCASIPPRRTASATQSALCWHG